MPMTVQAAGNTTGSSNVWGYCADYRENYEDKSNAELQTKSIFAIAEHFNGLSASTAYRP